MLTLSRTNNIRMLKISALATLLLLIIVYAIINSLNYTKGPRVDILFPRQNSITSSTTISIGGKAMRIIKITLNDNPISIDESGNWEKTIIIFPGLNVVKVYAEDQFGRNLTKKLNIVGTTNQ